MKGKHLSTVLSNVSIEVPSILGSKVCQQRRVVEGKQKMENIFNYLVSNVAIHLTFHSFVLRRF